MNETLEDLVWWIKGYRKYTFTLYTGQVISFRSKRKNRAIQTALDSERLVRLQQAEAERSHRTIINNLA